MLTRDPATNQPVFPQQPRAQESPPPFSSQQVISASAPLAPTSLSDTPPLFAPNLTAPGVCSNGVGTNRLSASVFNNSGTHPSSSRQVDEVSNIPTHVHSNLTTPRTRLPTTPVNPKYNPINPQTGKPVTWIDPLHNSRGKDFPPDV